MSTKNKYKYSEAQSRNSKYRRSLIKNATKPEVIFKRWLENKKIRFMFQKVFLKPFHRIVDFYIPKKKIIIEIDGGYHTLVSDKDFQKDTVWESMGYKTIRIKNEDVMNGSFLKNKDILNLWKTI